MPAPAAATDRTRTTRRELDGDFTPTEILDALGTPTAPQPSPYRPALAAAATWANLWQPAKVDRDVLSQLRFAAVPADDPRSPGTGAVPAHETDLLHRFETSPVCRPPVRDAAHGLDVPVADAWLDLAAHWAALSAASGDLRFLNGAYKLLGAVWIRWHTTNGGPAWAPLRSQLSHVAAQLDSDTCRLADDLNRRLVVAAPAASRTEVVELRAPGHLPAQPAASIVVLAGAGSAGARQFLAAATALPIRAVCWFEQPGSVDDQVAASAYATAWYPPEPTTRAGEAPTSGPPGGAPGPAETVASTWTQVAQAIQRHDPDLIILLGMPIVPPQILRIARLGVLNAHNGALPHYRGMDAVGWALLHNDPIVCTLHLARPAVDQGEIVAADPVPPWPADGLRRRVKRTQLRLLLAAAASIAATGALPSTTAQHGGRQFHRIHPHLRRVLDEWTGHTCPTAVKG